MTHISKLSIKFAIKKSIALMSSKIIERKSYIVNKSFRSYLTATILTLVIGQVCLTTDGIIMSHLVSPDALSAINLMSPFNMIMATVHALLAIGASVLAGKELGAQDVKKARQIFSVSIFSGLIAFGCFALLCLVFLPQTVNLLCPEQRYPALSDRLHEDVPLYGTHFPAVGGSEIVRRCGRKSPTSDQSLYD